MKCQMKRSLLFFLVVILLSVCIVPETIAEKKGSGKGTVVEQQTRKEAKTEKTNVKKTTAKETKKSDSKKKTAGAKNAAPKKISISGSTVVLKGKTTKLSAKVSPADASQDVTWTSSNKKIATVNTKGEVTGKKPGTVTITASSAKKKSVKAKFKITVTAQTQKVSVSAPSTSLSLVLKSMMLTAKATPADASQSFMWKSSNPKVAKVDKNGVVTAVKVGSATITATSTDGSKKRGSIKITITNEKLDFGGATVYIYDWWSNDDENHNARVAEPDEDTEKLYAYRDWLEKTYNVKIVETALSDWASNSSELANMVNNKDNSRLCLVAVPSDYVGITLSENLYMPWTIDLSDEKWNKADIEFMTKDGKVYGVHAGATEPRNCMYFNKRVLKEAGIDPESIYDAQKNGTWTWEMMETIMKKVQRDTDNDGINDFYGMVGSGDDLAIGLMFSNDASFFDYDKKGKLTVTADEKEALAALTKRKEWGETYMAPQPEGSNWDWFKDYWEQGTTAFYPGQTWQGFNDGSEMADMEDEWGCVMFPKGPDAKTYLAPANDNIYGIPNVYDELTAKKIQLIYDFYTQDTPGVDNESNWIGNKYNYTDERAVDETYAMMRENKHSAPNKTYLLGSVNDVLGSSLLWGPLGSMTAVEAVEAATPEWNMRLAVFNGEMTKEEFEQRRAEALARLYDE